MDSLDHYLKTELYSLIRKDSRIFDFLQTGGFDGMWYWDLENPENEWMNEQFWETLGYDPKNRKHLASEWQDIIHPDDLKLALHNFEKHLQDPDHPYDQVVRYQHRDGHTVWVRCRGIAIRDTDGKPLRMLGIHMDETKSRQLAEDNRKLKELYELATEAAHIGIWELDLASNSLNFDKRMLEIYHLNESGFAGTYDAWARLVHPDDMIEVQKQFKHSLDSGDDLNVDFRILLPSGQSRFLRAYAQVIHDKLGNPERLVGTNWDITEHRQLEEEIKKMALTDPLTGLPNRNLLEDRMSLAMAHSQRSEETLVVCMLDLDGFKPVNDTLGHDAGDRLLQEVARRLQQVLRPEDTVLRLVGDEFVLLIGGFEKELECESALKRVLQTIAQPYRIKNESVSVTASIGATYYPRDNSVADQLLRHADKAMYKAKDLGKNIYFLFDPTLESRHRANNSTIKRISKALDEKQFELYYQPQVDCSNGRVVGVEALIRWNHPILGLRQPGEFLPLIEQDDIIIRLSNWILDEATAQLETWMQQGLNLNIGINVSARHLLHGNFETKINELVERYPESLIRNVEFELVETAALEDMKTVGEIVNRFQDKGIAFALDDFGTGFSSLAHLKHMSVDTMKIDRSFVRDMLVDPGDLAIIQGVIGLSEAFQNKLIAEGVETIDQIMLLLGLGCNIMQGYSLAKPMPADKCIHWIRNFNMNPVWDAAQSSYPTRKDFDLLLMEVTHRHWLGEVKKAILKNGQETGHLPASYDECRTTRWYQNDGQKIFGNLPELHNLDILHHNTHRLGQELIDMAKAHEDERQVTDKLQQLEIASDKLINAIKRFRAL
jgi:diguanylate cyclase (GGDEF)-like protein/PAS domain S-box-containing protein